MSSCRRDGTYMALMKIATRDANPVIEVYETADLSQRSRSGSTLIPWRSFSTTWVSDSALVFALRQKVRDRIEGYNRGVYEFKLAMLNMEKRKTSDMGNLNLVVDPCPARRAGQGHSSRPGLGDDRGPGAKIKNLYLTRSYHELDLKTGKTRLKIRGRSTTGSILFDREGNPRLTQGWDRSTQHYVWYTRRPSASGWEEVHRQHEDEFGGFSLVGHRPRKAG